MLPIPTLPLFALAKIQAPRQRAGLIVRPLLEQALARALDSYRLTLLVAPAGYGKTAALTRMIHNLDKSYAKIWISGDEDDQLQRFLACLTTALTPYALFWQVAPEALATLAEAEEGLRRVAVEIANALATATVAQGLIVLDDLHRVGDPKVFELLQMILDGLPGQWGVVVASRVDPPLPLARWRGKGELAEFRVEALRFSADEVRTLLGADGGAASPDHVQILLERTDGWATGLRLLLSAKAHAAGTAGGGSTQRHVFDYLASEVLDDMPADLRCFLLRCAVLPELSAARCAQVSQMPQAAHLLAEIERRNLFVTTLDVPELTLRLHDLFRAFLEDRLQREFPEELPSLLRRAAADEPDLSRAVGYLARAADWDEAARILASRGPALLPVGGGPVIEQLLALFPTNELAHRADLLFLQGLCCFPRFDFLGMIDAMQQAAAIYYRKGHPEIAALALVYAYIGMENAARLDEAARGLAVLRAQSLPDAVRAFVCFGSAWAAYAQARTDAVAPLMGEMLDALARANDPLAWERCYFLSLFSGLPSMKPLLQRFADSASTLLSEQPTLLRASVAFIRVWLAFSEGQLKEAAQWLARADADVRWLGRPSSLMTQSWLTHTLIDAVRGDAASSRAAADENQHHMTQHTLNYRQAHEYEILFTALRAAWLLGDQQRLRALGVALSRTSNPNEWAASPDNRRFSHALVALADDRLAEAQALLQPLAFDIERSCFYPAAQARVLLADTELRLGRLADAATTLRPWLTAALQGGDCGGALLAGLPCLRRLSRADWGDHLPTDAVALLHQLTDQLQAIQADFAAPASTAQPTGVPLPPGGPLTDRELEILAQLAQGHSNKHIARELAISPHTVKRHVANILTKLGVDTRGQAAHWFGQQRND